jgi:thiol:disulfide interchange protein DsbD
MKRFFTLFLVFILSFATTTFAQDTNLVKFSYTYQRLNDKEVLLTIHAHVNGGHKLYSVHKVSDDALFSTVSFDSTALPLLKGALDEKGSIKSEKDSSIGGVEVKYTADSLTWQQKAMVPDTVTKSFDGKIAYLVKAGDEYKSGEEEFTITVKPGNDPKGNATVSSANDQKNMSMWSFFLGGLLAGLGAFIMPCIYAMVPVTVSFFTKRSTSRQQGIKNAIYYSLSIIGIFTGAGFLITLLFGPGALNALASSAFFNVFVFLMFVLFGISFLGAFEITLPASWSNKMDSKANFSSFSGIFFMALTLVIVSFSCTVPFIGLLTVWTSKGGMLAPLVGFLGFSLALSLPFALFAFFPALLNKMAKSGGWLNTVKVALGFVELALALKFLSSADLAYHWRILDREVYLSLWIVIFGLLGLYLLGKLKLHHDDDLPKNDYGHPYLTVTRLFFAIAALTFTVYLVPGL